MTIVVKVGGKALEINYRGIVSDIASNAKEGHELIVVHGGGSRVTEYCERLGVKTIFVKHPSGVRSRYTSLEELKVYLMVMAGLINKSLVSNLIKSGVKAFGLSGADGLLLKARRKEKILVVDQRGRKIVIEGGYTGKIVNVNKDIITSLLRMGYLPVIAPIAVTNTGTLLNVDADQAAFAVAKSVKARKLVILTDVDGVFLNGELLKEVRPEDVGGLLPDIGAGMNRKLLEAVNAWKAGVEEVIISNGLTPHPLTEALRGAGTKVRGR